MESFLSTQAIMLSQLLILIGIILMIGFAIYHTIMALASNPKEAIKSVAGVLIFIVILFLFYSLASGVKEGVFAGSKYKDITEGIMKLVAGGVSVASFLTLLTGLLMGISLILGVFQNR